MVPSGGGPVLLGDLICMYMHVKNNRRVLAPRRGFCGFQPYDPIYCFLMSTGKCCGVVDCSQIAIEKLERPGGCWILRTLSFGSLTATSAAKTPGKEEPYLQ